MKAPSCRLMIGVALASCFWVRAAAGEKAIAELSVCADPSNLPFSNAREEGYENRIASLLAEELQVPLRYTWSMQRRSFLRRTLKAGQCDVVIGVPLGLPGLLSTRPYYASTYVFVSQKRRGLKLGSFDDPALKGLSIGLHALGAEGANTPPASALARRGLASHVVGYPMWAEEAVENAPARIIDAVAAGEIDTAVVWGPFAGYFAKRHGKQLSITPAEADQQQPELAFRYSMALGVRVGDTELRDRLQAALERRQRDIEAILDDYGVPRVDTEPTLATTRAGN